MVIENAVEGAVETIIDIVHVGIGPVTLVLVESLADDIDSKGMC